mmetsp:Transcript_7203/g.15962  ORF Transcript_7203/g.15962 Transcript_7203/m.15962 type:complete len:227 (+) Transcript_7203:235-915(+)
MQPGVKLPCSRRLFAQHLLAIGTIPILEPARQASAALPGIGRAEAYTLSDVRRPEVCQGRTRLQDFVVVRYTGRFADGRPFDERYSKQPLVYELGSFYLPGFDEALEGMCVGSKFRISWASSPRLRPEDEALLPRGSSIDFDVELLTIRYSLFGEKMRDASNSYWFAPTPLSLTSPADSRGHASSKEPQVARANPFAVGPTENSIITNPSGVLKPLLQPFTGGDTK